MRLRLLPGKTPLRPQIKLHLPIIRTPKLHVNHLKIWKMVMLLWTSNKVVQPLLYETPASLFQLKSSLKPPRGDGFQLSQANKTPNKIIISFQNCVGNHSIPQRYVSGFYFAKTNHQTCTNKITTMCQLVKLITPFKLEIIYRLIESINY